MKIEIRDLCKPKDETGAKFYDRPKKQILDKLISFGMKRIAKEWPDQIWSF